MGNSLHKLISGLSGHHGGLVVDQRIWGQVTRDHLEEVRRHAKNAVCFDFGEADRLENITGELHELRLPYPVCWVEAWPVLEATDGSAFQSKDVRCAALMVEPEEEGGWMRLYDFFLEKKGWVLHSTTTVRDNGGQAEIGESIPPEPIKGGDRYPSGIAFKGFVALQCNNVVAIENKPSRVASMLAKSKKKPLFSTWTLHLKQGNGESRNLGGTHSPPRLHLRRGHIREYKPGKYTWVQACVVGRKELGIIHKDYAVDNFGEQR